MMKFIFFWGGEGGKGVGPEGQKFISLMNWRVKRQDIELSFEKVG